MPPTTPCPHREMDRGLRSQPRNARRAADSNFPLALPPPQTPPLPLPTWGSAGPAFPEHERTDRTAPGAARPRGPLPTPTPFQPPPPAPLRAPPSPPHSRAPTSAAPPPPLPAPRSPPGACAGARRASQRPLAAAEVRDRLRRAREAPSLPSRADLRRRSLKIPQHLALRRRTSVRRFSRLSPGLAFSPRNDPENRSALQRSAPHPPPQTLRVFLPTPSGSALLPSYQFPLPEAHIPLSQHHSRAVAPRTTCGAFP